MDEAYLKVANFATSDEQDPNIIAEQGQVLVTMMNTRLSTIHNEEGLSHFCVGGIIKKLREHNSWKLFDGAEEHWVFGDFCKNVLQMSHGKAMGLLRVWEKSQNVGMTPEEVNEVGWSVADDMLRFAKNNTDIALMLEEFRKAESKNDFVQRLKSEGIAGNNNVPRVRKKKVAFKVDDTEEQFVQETLERAAIQMGGELNKDTSPDAALVFIMTEWRQFRQKA